MKRLGAFLFGLLVAQAWETGEQGGQLPLPRIRDKYFSGKNHVKFGHFVNFSGVYHVKFGNFLNFSGKYHVKFGHFVNFSCMYFRAKVD